MHVIDVKASTNVGTPARPQRRYLHEIDFMRVFFTFGVLLNHTVNTFTSAMDSGSAAYTTLRSLRVMFHYTRMGFIFISGVVLTMAYFNKHDWPTFFRKRYNGSIWPYLIWNALLIALTIVAGTASYGWSAFGHHYLLSIEHGSNYYLYYMLLVMQLYLLFPAVLWLLHRFEGHHNVLLGISLALQLLLVAFVKYVQPQLDTTNWPYWFKATTINIFAYQFYFMLGAYFALHYHQVYAWLNRHIKLITVLAAMMAVGMILYFRIWDQQVLGLDTDAATSLHQPYIALYDTVMLGFLFWVGKRYAAWHNAGRMPAWLATFFRNAAKVSFGIYLCQIAGLLLLGRILAALQLADWMLFLLVPVGWVFVGACSFAIAWFCYKVAPFGILIGRPNWHPLATRRAADSAD